MPSICIETVRSPSAGVACACVDIHVDIDPSGTHWIALAIDGARAVGVR